MKGMPLRKNLKCASMGITRPISRLEPLRDYPRLGERIRALAQAG